MLNSKRRLSEADKSRLGNVKEQQRLLLPRIKYVRNGIFSLSLAATFFVLTSFWIALGYFPITTSMTQVMIHASFVTGMFLVLCGVLYLAVEMYHSYKIILVEVNEEG